MGKGGVSICCRSFAGSVRNNGSLLEDSDSSTGIGLISSFLLVVGVGDLNFQFRSVQRRWLYFAEISLVV